MSQENPSITPGSDPARTTHNPLVGVRGWLAFYCTVLIVLNPLATFLSFYLDHQGIELLRAFDRESAQAVEYFSQSFWVASFALTGFGVIVGLRLINRSRNAVMLAKIHTAAVPILSVLALVASFGAPGSPEMQGALIHGSVLGAIKSAGYFALWFTYLSMSRRVQHTYGGNSMNYWHTEAETAPSERQSGIPLNESVPPSSPDAPTMPEAVVHEENVPIPQSYNQPMASPSSDEEAFYEIVATELAQQTHKTGIWTKAFADADGSPERTRALYIRYRVAQLADARNCERQEDWRKHPFPPIAEKSTETAEAAKVVIAPPQAQKEPEAPDISKADETSENSASSPSPARSDMGAWDSVKPIEEWGKLPSDARNHEQQGRFLNIPLVGICVLLVLFITLIGIGLFTSGVKPPAQSSFDVQQQSQSSSGLHPNDKSKSEVQREFARQVTPLMFPESEDGNSPLGAAIAREIARLKTAESSELYTEDAPLSITGRMADSLGIKPLMTVDDASSIVFNRWKKNRTDAQPKAQSTSGAQTHDQSKFDVQREFATQIAVLMFPDGPNGDTPLGAAVTREIARLRTSEGGELYSEDAPLLLTGRLADSLGIEPLMTVDDAASIVFTRWKKIRTDAAK